MTTDDTAAELPDASTIHERGLERARRITQAWVQAMHDGVTIGESDLATTALGTAFQAAADALHEEADAAAEARKRGHQSLTKDLRNTAGRIVGIAQDLMELSKLEPIETIDPVRKIQEFQKSIGNLPPSREHIENMIRSGAEFDEHGAPIPAERLGALGFPADQAPLAPKTDIGSYSASYDLRQPEKERVTLTNSTDKPIIIGADTIAPGDTIELHAAGVFETPYTEATDPVIEQADVAEHLARLERERGDPDGTGPSDVEQVKAYLRGDTDVAPTLEIAPELAVLINASDDAGREGADVMTPGMPDPCQPIGCDNGHHLPGCPYADRDKPEELTVQPNPFLDPEPYRPQVRAPFPGAELHAYGYEALMTPVKPDLVPAHWSWSQLTTIESCGLQYRGQRLEGVPQQPQWANVGGTTFHTVTEAFDRGAWQAGGADLLPEVHPELIKQRWETAFAAEIQRVAAQTGIEPGERMDNWRASSGGKEGYTWWLIEGERMLEIYIHNRRKLDKAAREAGTLAVPLMLWINDHRMPDNSNHVPVIEYAYERKIFGPVGELTIKGVIDRAYRCADGTIIIKDLKTGSMAPQSAQLGEYAWAIMDLLGAGRHEIENPSIVIKGCFYDARKGLFTDPIDVLTEHPSEEYVYRYSTAEAARRGGVFMPHRTPFCNGCSIAYACPVKGTS